MSNGFIYVVDAHFIDKIEEQKNPEPKCLCFAHTGVQHILCCVLFSLSSSCVPFVASFSGLSILIAPTVFSNVY